MSNIATGSLWNKNNWHWEEKNYNKMAIALLSYILEELTLSDSGMEVKISNPQVKGEASISVRKAKQVIAFDLYFEAQYTVTSSSETATGSIKCESFSVEDAEDGDYEVRVSQNESGSFSDTAKELVRTKFLNNVLKKKLQSFASELSKTEADAEKLRQDKLIREAELKKAEEARLKTGDIQKEILEKRKEEDQQKRSNAIEKITSNQNQAPVTNVPISKTQNFDASGSQWNVNSYHWEERNYNTWFKEELIKKLDNIYIQDTIKFNIISNSILCKAEASSSVRKGKKVIIYDASFKSSYKINSIQNGKTESDMQGEISIDNFNSEESVEDVVIQITIDKEYGFNHFDFKNNVIQKIKSSLVQLIEELRQK